MGNDLPSMQKGSPEDRERCRDASAGHGRIYRMYITTRTDNLHYMFNDKIR
jgi:hypothetical protein